MSVETEYDGKYPELGAEGLDSARVDIRIDKHSLDVAVSMQSMLFQDISDRAALAVSVRDEAADELSSVEYRLDRVVRKSHAGEKIVEKQIAGDVKRRREYKVANDWYLLCKYRAQQWASLKASFDQRASMLKLMVNLFTANYYTTRSMGGGEDVKEAVTRGMRSRINEARRGSRTETRTIARRKRGQ